jgi:group II intron reverse transcriptase/maturase
MIQACDALNILQSKNRHNPKWINRDLYRLLYNPTLHLLAYERLKSKPGNMTPGVDGQTLDGFSADDIEKLIARLKTEQYQPAPVRRVYIPKAHGNNQRPLGVPAPREKVLQECVRLILEAIYEPTFHENSHGFRPGRSCHTALESLRRNWAGMKWVIEADIADCFGSVNHHRLLDILRERIQDDRFINLIRKFLRAGYLENWEYQRTYSGTPQGSVLSPILMNVYLDKLDQKLDALCRRETQGETRKKTTAYAALFKQRKHLLEQGETDPTLRESFRGQLRELNRRILQTPVCDYHDPAYRRVKFLRYADDVVIGVIGPKALAEQIKAEVAEFLADELDLELSRKKTLITHLATEQAHFLGYAFKTAQPRLRRRNLQQRGSPHNVTQTAKVASGNIKLLVPLRDLSPKLTKYMADGQPACVAAFTNQPVEHIIEHYNAVISGWYNYYQLGENVCRLNYARYVLLYSLAKTLAHKERCSVGQIFQKYGKDIAYRKPNGRLIHFFNQPLTQVKKARTAIGPIDRLPAWGPRRTRPRLLDACVVCEGREQVEMHHVRHIRKRGERLHGFSLYLAAINRKQVPVCRKCHRDIHNGKYDGASLASLLEQIQGPGSET